MNTKSKITILRNKIRQIRFHLNLCSKIIKYKKQVCMLEIKHKYKYVTIMTNMIRVASFTMQGKKECLHYQW